MRNLKVKMMLCAMLMSCSFLMAGCGSMQQMTEVFGGQATEVQTEDDEEGERSEAGESEEGDQERDEEIDVNEVERDEKLDEEQDGEQDEEDSSVKPNASGAPVLGQEDIADYEGFEYLYWEQLRTESEKNEATGKMESQELEVFIPISDYTYTDRDRVSSEKLGIELVAHLEPYLYDSEDYLVYENLENYLEIVYDPFYYTEYEDLVISEVEEIDENSARATVEYCEYDEYDEIYRTIFETYYLKMLENDVYVLVVASVDHSEVSGKTPMLIDELEEFYQFEIDFDKDRAQQKQDAYLTSGGSNMHSTGYILFELPEGWDEDYDSKYGYDTDVFAPGGSISASGCGITFEQEDNDAIDKDIIRGNEEMLVEIIKEEYAEDENLSEVEYYGETCLGETIKTTLTIEVDGVTANAEVYFIIDNYYIYRVTAMAKEGAKEDPFTVVADILENGQVR